MSSPSPGRIPALTPLQRLALSRHALRQAMQPGTPLSPDPEITRLQEAEKALQAETALHGKEKMARSSPLAPQPASSATPACPPAATQTASPQPDSTPPGANARQGLAGKARAGHAGPNLALEAGQRLLRSWWKRQPLHVLADVGEPLLQTYARRHPYRLLALAAATGAAVVVLKPWKWPSARRWVGKSVNRQWQALDTSQLAQMVMESLLHDGRPPR